MIVNNRLAVVGSTNMDPLSLKMLEEGSLVVEDPQLVAQMTQSFERDVRSTLEIRWEWWRKRSVVERLGHELAALIGRFL
jgi:cardiolipin synthase